METKEYSIKNWRNRKHDDILVITSKNKNENRICFSKPKSP